MADRGMLRVIAFADPQQDVAVEQTGIAGFHGWGRSSVGQNAAPSRHTVTANALSVLNYPRGHYLHRIFKDAFTFRRVFHDS